MSEYLPTIIGACVFGKDSTRPIATVTLTASLTGSGIFSDHTGAPIDETMTVSGSLVKTWTRKPFPPPGLGIVDVAPPGDGFFYAIDYLCGCCLCRTAFVFDDAFSPMRNDDETGVPIPPDDEYGGYDSGAFLGTTMDLTGSSTTDPTPILPPVGINALFWHHKTPPCRKADGPLPFGPPMRMFADIQYPSVLPSFSGDESGNPSSSVVLTGNHSVVSYPFFEDDQRGWGRFNAPLPCSIIGDSYGLQVAYSDSFHSDDGLKSLSRDITTNFALSFA